MRKTKAILLSATPHIMFQNWMGDYGVLTFFRTPLGSFPWDSVEVVEHYIRHPNTLAALREVVELNGDSGEWVSPGRLEEFLKNPNKVVLCVVPREGAKGGEEKKVSPADLEVIAVKVAVVYPYFKKPPKKEV